MSTVTHSSMFFPTTLQNFSFFNTTLQQTGLIRMVSTDNYKYLGIQTKLCCVFMYKILSASGQENCPFCVNVRPGAGQEWSTAL